MKIPKSKRKERGDIGRGGGEAGIYRSNDLFRHAVSLKTLLTRM